VAILGKRLNVGAGGNILDGYDNLDRIQIWGATYLEFDKELLSRYGDNEADEIVCHGCLNEFEHNPVETMNEFWRVLRNGGKLDIVVAVVDNGIGPFRDPIAKRYLSSEWVQYFNVDNVSRYNGGRGLGFIGAFRILLEEIGGERHYVLLEAIKDA
jgi:predicted SAM-dependent methyltransferase